jgi:primary-amine oxidase
MTAPVSARRALFAAVLACACSRHAPTQPEPEPEPAPASAPASARARAATHPLDQLTRDEITAGVALLRAATHLGPDARILILTLREPSKEELRGFVPGAPFRREATAVVLDAASNEVDEAVLDLRAGKVASWTRIDGVKPWLFEDDTKDIPDLVKADPRWQEAMKRRGITDYAPIFVDPWTNGVLGEDAEGHRYVRALAFIRDEKGAPFSHPIYGVMAMVDTTAKKVVSVSDTGVRPMAPHFYDIAALSDPPSARLAPAQSGPQTFTLDGNHVTWKHWDLRFALDEREGLVLHQVAFIDRGTRRSILHRAALSELVVPYADPDPDWRWRAAFDVGEEGLGRETTSIEAGREVPADAKLVDVTFADAEGGLQEIPRAIAVYERDGGMLWKHQDAAGHDFVRRGRQLVVASYVTLDQYNYGFSWIFSEDGTIELEAGVTGLLLVKGAEARSCSSCDPLAAGADKDPAAAGRVDRFGTLVDENLVAPNHQHYLDFRLDFDIDGTDNSVVELNAGPPPEAAADPTSESFVVDEHILRDEREARRELSPATSRMWKIVNPTSRTGLGHLRGYALVPGAQSAFTYMGANSRVRRQARFIEKQLYVTRYHPDEKYAAGPFPDQVAGSNGLPAWSGDEPLVGTDVVVWHTFGITHHPRPEDWPIMSFTKMNFTLLPMGFFDRNPALDDALVAGGGT